MRCGGVAAVQVLWLEAGHQGHLAMERVGSHKSLQANSVRREARHCRASLQEGGAALLHGC